MNAEEGAGTPLAELAVAIVLLMPWSLVAAAAVWGFRKWRQHRRSSALKFCDPHGRRLEP
ncbi:MAG TPA: hypothetical protein VNL38_01485 [Candidatus Nitrosotenuis sp.]|nr:hypothetical protein [Candidatus Nitrosotenuis sp.]